VVELAHDSLLFAWPRLRGWIEQEEPFRAWLEGMRAKAEEAHDDPEQVLSGNALVRAEEMLERNSGVLRRENAVAEFIRRSLEALKARRCEEERRKREAAEILRQEGEKALRMQSLFLAQRAREELAAGDPGTAALLALAALPAPGEALPRPLVPAAADVLRQALETDRERLVLIGHDSPLRQARFCPTGERIATAGEDGTVRSWDSSTGRECDVLVRFEAEARSVTFDSEGKRMLAVSRDGEVVLLDLALGGAPERRHHHKLRPRSSAMLAPGGELVIAAAGASRPLSLSGAGTVSADAHEDLVAATDAPITALWLHRYVGLWISGHADGTLSAWAPGSLHLVAVAHGAFGAAIAFLGCAAAHERIIVAARDGTTAVWHLTPKGKLYCRYNLPHGLERTAISPDGLMVFTLRQGTLGCIVLDAPKGSDAETQRKLPVAGVPGQLIITRNSEMIIASIGRSLVIVDRAAWAAGENGTGSIFCCISCCRGPIRHLSPAMPEGVLVASADGTARVLSSRPAGAMLGEFLEQGDVVALARRRLIRGLTRAQRVAHYLDLEASPSEAQSDERVPAWQAEA
jgi:hypothetical protein